MPAQTAPVQSFNTRVGAITLAGSDVTTALRFTPYSAANPAGYITASQVPAYALPKVATEIDPAIKSDQVDMTVTLNDGRKLHKFIEHAVGSQDNPMSDAQLEDKFTGLAEGILPNDRTRALMDLCWKG